MLSYFSHQCDDAEARIIMVPGTQGEKVRKNDTEIHKKLVKVSEKCIVLENILLTSRVLLPYFVKG